VVALHVMLLANQSEMFRREYLERLEMKTHMMWFYSSHFPFSLDIIGGTQTFVKNTHIG